MNHTSRLQEITRSILDYVLTKSDLDSIDEIPLEESLLSTGVLDSFGIIELVEFIESAYLLVIPDEDFSVENFGTVTRIAAYIDSRLPV